MNDELDVTPGEHGTVPPDHRPDTEQPRWRREFPIHWGQDEYVARRDLVKYMLLTSVALAVGQCWLVVKRLLRRRPSAPPPAPIASLDELPVGGAKTFEYPRGSHPKLLVRTGPASFVAYEQQCPHLQCPVVPAAAEGKLHCPCHNGWFDLHTGQPLAGPPRRALGRVGVEIRGRTVYAVEVEEPA